ncbi:hypothetical protein QOL99_00355 [Deinococcus sp. MIMF12]|uniref:MarR family transcriptional regulator n=1 Tax=Deinococcus rhizophilus TaxID=3049544 RepID=A0ABT7JC29_9DEIO|nr:hypothetical protein [Deinococcus rhizophilus]MDL2342599.1 hypothetical protein [Deinococcus rhizophilus]
MPRQAEQVQTMRVLGASRHAPVRTAEQVAARLKIVVEAARARLKTLMDRGDAERLPGNTYRLTPQGAERLRKQDRALRHRRERHLDGRAA